MREAMDSAPARLLGHLPAVFRAADTSGELRRLLAAFEGVLFGDGDPDRPGIEEQVDAIPRHVAPLPGPGPDGMACPDRFLPWLAEWVAFTPHALFAPPALRRIVAGIVPLYSWRGTRVYLERLLRLCFEEIDAVAIDEAPGAGLRLGQARIGIDSLLGTDSPFRFRVVLGLRGAEPVLAGFESRVRAIIDFARPAHTAYDLAFGSPAQAWRGDDDAEWHG